MYIAVVRFGGAFIYIKAVEHRIVVYKALCTIAGKAPLSIVACGGTTTTI
jgi:hypothetical protein